MDDTDLRAAILRLEAENKRLWSANDELMRDQTASEKKIEKLEASPTRHKEALAEIFRDQLFAITERLERLEKGLKPPAEGSVG